MGRFFSNGTPETIRFTLLDDLQEKIGRCLKGIHALVQELAPSGGQFVFSTYAKGAFYR